MRAYKFLNADFALKSLSERRLKISTFDDLNDPFELFPYDLSNRINRRAMRLTKAELSRNRGILCFSATWRDPVLWAHYADKHKGICIGFEIPEESNISRPVKYETRRLPFPKKLTLADAHVGEALLFTKYSKWEYEQEIRIFLDLKDKEGGLYFRDFDDTIRPVIVIAGTRCPVGKRELKQALGSLAQTVKLIKARAGFKRFEIVEDQRGFRETSKD